MFLKKKQVPTDLCDTRGFLRCKTIPLFLFFFIFLEWNIHNKETLKDMDITDLEKLTGKDMAALVKLRKIYRPTGFSGKLLRQIA